MHPIHHNIQHIRRRLRNWEQMRILYKEAVFRSANTYLYFATLELSQRTHAIWRDLMFGKEKHPPPPPDHGSIQLNNTC